MTAPHEFRYKIVTLVAMIAFGGVVFGGSGCGKKSAPVPPEDARPAKSNEK
jgi:hypothetical protein